ncbi:MAG TPA: heme-binding protein, partial [Verrucomicrobiota bacterium]|nr:heme-binding protein [Verrucomicrobiota bacterium]
MLRHALPVRRALLACGLVAATFRLFAAEDFGAAATPPESLKVAPGFRVELLYTVPKGQQGSWVAMANERNGRLVVSDQYGRLYRLTPPPVGTTAAPRIETIDLEIGHAQGLLYAFDSLYVMVNDDKFQGRGLYRLRDTNGDDRYDSVELLRKLEGGGEHGPHAILLSPDQKSLTIVIGNQTRLTDFAGSRVPKIWGEDHLLPRLWDGNGFMKGVLGPGGWMATVDPDGKNWELKTVGFRNQYDAAFNHAGDLFTYDADMEWDINTPWYRPTRVLLSASGADFGWRSGAGKWPAWYPDSLPAVVDVGPGSPTGVVFGYGAKFPAKYQEAFFIADWSFGKLYAVHLEPKGAGYTGTLEEFVSGQPLALTDLVIAPDGAMYFAIGGRRTQSALYRVTYTGAESTAPVKRLPAVNRDHALRRQLEAFHGRPDPQAVSRAWRHLGSGDPYLRHAARTAVEWQPAAEWRDRALKEKDPQAAITALIALARVSGRDEPHRRPGDPAPDPALHAQILAALDRLDFARLKADLHPQPLPAHSLAFTRFAPPDESTRQRLIAKFEPLFPTRSRELNGELAGLLVYLESPNAAARLVAALAAAPTQEEQMEYARALRVLRTGWTPELRREYLGWYVKAAAFKGGASLAGFLRDMKNDALATLTEDEKIAFKDVIEAKPVLKNPMEVLAQRQHVRDWTVAELAPLVEAGLRGGGRDFERGRRLFGEVACSACHRYE